MEHKNSHRSRLLTPRLLNVLLWAVQILMALYFLAGAVVPKLAGRHQSVHEFALIGAGQWFRYLVGLIELVGVIGLLTPGLAGPAAAWLAGDMAVATVVNATVLRNTTFASNVWLTLILFAVFVLLAYGRRQQIKVLAAPVLRTATRRAFTTTSSYEGRAR